jgi:hypothetical protein
VASKSLEEWPKILWENEYVVCEVLLCAAGPLFVSPRGWGFAPPFIDQGGGGLHARRATWLRGGARRAML